MLFDEWLTNLRKQGDVEVLDPSLETVATQNSASAATPVANSSATPVANAGASPGERE